MYYNTPLCCWLQQVTVLSQPCDLKAQQWNSVLYCINLWYLLGKVWPIYFLSITYSDYNKFIKNKSIVSWEASIYKHSFIIFILYNYLNASIYLILRYMWIFLDIQTNKLSIWFMERNARNSKSWKLKFYSQVIVLYSWTSLNKCTKSPS